MGDAAEGKQRKVASCLCCVTLAGLWLSCCVEWWYVEGGVALAGAQSHMAKVSFWAPHLLPLYLHILFPQGSRCYAKDGAFNQLRSWHMLGSNAGIRNISLVRGALFCTAPRHAASLIPNVSPSQHFPLLYGVHILLAFCRFNRTGSAF